MINKGGNEATKRGEKVGATRKLSRYNGIGEMGGGQVCMDVRGNVLFVTAHQPRAHLRDDFPTAITEKLLAMACKCSMYDEVSFRALITHFHVREVGLVYYKYGDGMMCG